MSTPRSTLVVLAVFACAASSVCSAAERDDPAEKIDLRILYCGRVGSDREKDFSEFLSKHFREVQTRDLKRFDADAAKAFDVVILDWDKNDFKAPRPAIPGGYRRPTVTVGVPGAFICSRLRLKMSYL